MILGLPGPAFSAGAASPRKSVNYEQFGAVGDGVHDDMDAIVAAHAAANEAGVPVKLTGGRTYYIGNVAKTAVIRTDVDFADSKFIIDDVDMDMKDITSSVFIVAPDEDAFAVEGLCSLKKGQKKLGVRLGTRCLVHVVNDGKKVYIRYGLNRNNGTSQQEAFVADAAGRVSKGSAIVWDYDTVTSAKAYPIPRKTLVITGGTFVTKANQCPSRYTYHARNFLVKRSNVRVEGMTHLVTGELDHGAPYNGFLYISEAADVTLSDCVLTAHKTYSTIGSAGKPVRMGSYDLGAYMCVGVLYRNCTQTTDIDDKAYWGLFGSNFCKELQMDGCRISRFDAHMGVENVKLTGCTFGHMGVRAVGFGTMLIKDCEIRDVNVVSLREDYGSSWDGDVIIKNCVLRPVTDKNRNLTIISGSNGGTHDFGYLCRLPRRVIVDGLLIDDSVFGGNEKYDGPAFFGTFNRDASKPGLLPYPIPETLSVRNVSVSSGKSLRLSDNEALFSGLQL